MIFTPATCWRQLKRLRRYVASGRLLGVGCATKFFLDEACALGWNVEGVDISAFGVEYARKRFSLEVNHGELTDLSLLEGSMDQVTMWNVIEYVSDLAAYVQCLARRVREVKETLGVSTQALYINPLDIIQVTARLR